MVSDDLVRARAERVVALLPHAVAVEADMVDAYGLDLGGHCEEAAFALAARLREAGFGAVVARGTYTRTDGERIGHFWVESDPFVVDPTRSQFGPFLPLVEPISGAEGYDPEEWLDPEPTAGMRP